MVPEASLPLTIVTAVALVGAVVLAIAVIDLRKTRKIPRYSEKILPTALL
jgi:hypothetical protein